MATIKVEGEKCFEKDSDFISFIAFIKDSLLSITLEKSCLQPTLNFKVSCKNANKFSFIML